MDGIGVAVGTGVEPGFGVGVAKTDAAEAAPYAGGNAEGILASPADDTIA